MLSEKSLPGAPPAKIRTGYLLYVPFLDHLIFDEDEDEEKLNIYFWMK